MANHQKFQGLLKQMAFNVRRIRKERELTQEDMRELGFDYRHFQRIESGKHAPSLYTLFRLAEALDCDIEDLFRKNSKA